jgi:hypothetical protein
MDKAPDNKALAGSDIPFPFESEIGRRLTIGDICHYAPGMLNKVNKEGKTSWDSFAYALMMGHNVYCHIVAVQRAQQLMDIEIAKTKNKINWRHWKKVKSSDMSDEYSDWVPRNILYFSSFIEDLFNTGSKADAFAMIEQAGPFLKSLEGARLQGGPAQNAFGSLFEIETVTDQDEIDLANPDDDDLRALEESVTGE